MELETGDVVLCTVDRIVGTIVFVKIDDGGEGSIILSEIAPGRIRNLRNYVVPKKKIVCKILRIDNKGNIHLSLRRVTQKERKELMEQHKQEKKSISLLKSVLKEADKAVKEIKKQGKVLEFLENAKQNSKKLEKLVGKKDSQKILEILKKEKQKKSVIKKEFSLKTTKSNGLTLIKNTVGKIEEAEVKYISAGKYSIKIESDDLKKAGNKLKNTVEKIKENAKKQGVNFTIKEGKN